MEQPIISKGHTMQNTNRKLSPYDFQKNSSSHRYDTDAYLTYDSVVHTTVRLHNWTDLKDLDSRVHQFRSVYSYDSKDFEKWLLEQKRKQYQDPTYKISMSTWRDSKPFSAARICIDIDTQTLVEAAVHTKKLIKFLQTIGAPFDLFFSGSKGFHIELDSQLIGSPRSFSLHKEHKNLVKKLASMAGVPFGRHSKDGGGIDAATFNRNQKWRMTRCPRESGTQKMWIPATTEYDSLYVLKVLDTLEGLERMVEISKEEVFWPYPPERKLQPNPVLVSLYREAVESVEQLPPYTLLKNGKQADPESKYDPKSIEDLVTRASQDASGEDETGWPVKCLFHDDATPSAKLWKNGWLWCSTCARNHPPEMVAKALNLDPSKLIAAKEPIVSSPAQRIPTVDEAREQMQKKIKAAVDTALQDPRYLGVVNAPVGLGKSTYTRALLRDLEIPFLYLTPTHALAQEAHEHVSGGIIGKIEEIEPRCMDTEMDGYRELPIEIDPKTGAKLNEKISRYEEIQYRISYGGYRASVCATCPLNPHSKSYDKSQTPCEFQVRLKTVLEGKSGMTTISHPFMPDREEESRGNAYLVQSYLGTETLEKALEGREILVIDEGCLDKLIPVETFDLRDLEGIETVFPKNSEEYRALSDISQGRLSALHSSEAGTWGENAEWMSRIDKNTKIYSGLRTALQKVWSNEEVEEGHKYIGLEIDNLNTIQTRFLRLLAQDIYLNFRLVSHGNRKTLLVRGVLDIRKLNVPVLILDASATEVEVSYYGHLFDREPDFIKIQAQNLGTRIIQDPSRTWSISRQRAYMGLSERGVEEGSFDSLDPAVSSSTASEPDAKYADLVQMIRAAKHDGEVGIITSKSSPIAEQLIEDGLIEYRHWAWYSALRGSNRLARCKTLFIIGDPSPNDIAYDIEGFRLTAGQWSGVARGSAGHYAIDFDRGYQTEHYRLNYSSVRPTESFQGKLVYRRVILDELYQAVGRIRGMNHDVQIVALCSPDVYTSDHSYEVRTVIEGRGASYSEIQDPHLMMRLLHETFLSHVKIARLLGCSESVVRKIYNRDRAIHDQIRLEYMNQLFDSGLNQKEVAKKMGCSVDKIQRKLS